MKYILSKIFIISILLQGCFDFGTNDKHNEPEESLRLLWSFEYTQQVDGLSTVMLQPALISDGEVITALDHQYNSLSQDDGTLNWQCPLPDNMYESVSLLTYDQKYLYGKGNRNANYFAINLQSGEMVWRKTNPKGDFDDHIHDTVDKNYVYLTADAPMLYVFDKQTGDYVDTIQIRHEVQAVVSTGHQLYMTQAWKPDSTESAYGRIIGLDAETHQQNWEYETTKGGFYYADLVLKEGVLYSGTTSGPSVFVALDATTGQVKWEHEGLLTFGFTLGDGKVFVNDGQYIVALDQQTGKELWRQDFSYATTSNVAYLNGHVYHAHNGELYVMDAQTGELVAGPIASPDGSGFYNLNAGNGKVFVQSDFHLYAYEGYHE